VISAVLISGVLISGGSTSAGGQIQPQCVWSQ
jgi:hypothetical protein